MSAPFPTTVVGSYPQPDWLIDRAQPRPIAFAKLQAMVAGAAIVRDGLAG